MTLTLDRPIMPEPDHRNSDQRSTSLVLRFADDVEDRFALGNKGANLVKMSRIGMPVPQGFTLSIDMFRYFMRTRSLPVSEIREAIQWLEEQAGNKLGEGLQVSVRSSGPVSMPGMMDTVLNVDSEELLLLSAKEVFSSWNTARAREYRRLHDIDENLGTAVVVQRMVFGNQSETSGTGVLFTRNPNSGANELFGEYLPNAQGEELVSGATTPLPLSALKEQLPDTYAELNDRVRQLERHFGDMQDVEFTIEDGDLFILQTRSGKRTGQAAVKIAVDLAKEGLISKKAAVLQVTPQQVESLLYSRLEDAGDAEPIVAGLPAAPGAAVGKAYFTPEEAAEQAKTGPVILVRPETTPDDIQGIAAAAGVLTCRGGYSSHASIVARAMGKPCITGAEDAQLDLEAGVLRIGATEVKAGDMLTVDGTTGNVYAGELELVDSEGSAELDELLEWADDSTALRVWANADTPEMVRAAKRFGARGIGLLRTERMFNEPESLRLIREYILTENSSDRRKALTALRDRQREDFIEIFKALEGMPLIVRLLDMPLHEFLPEEYGHGDARIQSRRTEMAEVNPMMGHRGVRLGISQPGLYKMQVDAIQEARAEVPADVRLMIPQVISQREAIVVKEHIDYAGLEVGVMIETVRACMRADRLAEHTDFFSFGTNDLTQAVFSFSREDAEKKFLNTYLDKGLLQDNPFTILDENGVARVMDMAIQWGRHVKPGLGIGICGEHGGNPESVRTAYKLGVSYVSCSPYRIPVSRMAAAHAALEDDE